MTRLSKCDACQTIIDNSDFFSFAGKSFDDGNNMEFWQGDLCYDCQRIMRSSISILGRRDMFMIVDKITSKSTKEGECI